MKLRTLLRPGLLALGLLLVGPGTSQAASIGTNFKDLTPGSVPPTLIDGDFSASFDGEVLFFRNGPFYREGSNRAFGPGTGDPTITFSTAANVVGWARGSKAGDTDNVTGTVFTEAHARLWAVKADGTTEIWDVPNVSFRGETAPDTRFAFLGVKQLFITNAAAGSIAAFGEIQASPVPVPAALPLMVSALAGLGLVARRRARGNEGIRASVPA